MAEDLEVTGKTKEEKYMSLLSQVKGLIGGETDAVANMANVCGALKYGLGYFWVGFYLVKGGELVLGPFQGPVACTRIRKGRGVCGRCWEKGETIVVEDVPPNEPEPAGFASLGTGKLLGQFGGSLPSRICGQ